MTSTVATPRNFVSRQPSIVTHRWFPKVIGLWFAALFGLCSLALASDVLERVVTTLGVDRIVPAAAPPLGQTARLLLAMAMAGVGEILGLIIGGRLAARHRSRSQRRVETAQHGDAACDDTPQVRDRDRHADAPPRKPLSATDDLGGIDRASPRRALNGETDHERRPFFEGAPLPGADLSPCVDIDGGAEPSAAPHMLPFSDPATHEILDLETCATPFGQEEVLEVRPFAAPEGSLCTDDTPAGIVAEAGEAVIAEPAALPRSAPVVDIVTASLDTLGVVHLSERLALALHARRERRARLMPAAAVVAPEDAPSELAHDHDILARRAPKASAEMAPVNEVAENPDGPEPDELGDDESEASAAGYSSLLAMGTSFERSKPVRIDEPASAEIEPVVIFPGQSVRPSNPFSAPAAAPFATPLGQPGAVAAPDHAALAHRAPTTGTMPAPDREETDRALRAALASLQRISGAR